MPHRNAWRSRVDDVHHVQESACRDNLACGLAQWLHDESVDPFQWESQSVFNLRALFMFSNIGVNVGEIAPRREPQRLYPRSCT